MCRFALRGGFKSFGGFLSGRKGEFHDSIPSVVAEYLRAIDAQLYRAYEMIDTIMAVPEVIHQQLTDAYKAYLVLGGMPEAVSAYIDTKDWDEAKAIQDGILQSYSLDFAKHINNKDIPRVFQVWGNLQDQLHVKTRSSDMLTFKRSQSA